jgi:hypothetical protein
MKPITGWRQINAKGQLVVRGVAYSDEVTKARAGTKVHLSERRDPTDESRLIGFSVYVSDAAGAFLTQFDLKSR